MVVSPPSTEVNYANTIFMSCIAYIGRMNRSVDQLQTTFSWWDRNSNQLVNRSDGSVSIFTDSFNQNGLIFLRSILQICNFTTSDTGDLGLGVIATCKYLREGGKTYLFYPSRRLIRTTGAVNRVYILDTPFNHMQIGHVLAASTAHAQTLRR